MRTFISIKLPPKVLMQIKGIQENLPEFLGRKTELKNLHLTMKFLGEASFERTEEIKKRLRQIKFRKFESEIGETGIFDNRKSKRYPRKIIVWLSLSNCEGLQKEVDEALRGLYEKEQRFMGHLTIARVKKVQNKKKFIEDLRQINVPKRFFFIDKFYLMESKPKKEGPEYTVLEEYKLDD